MMLTWAEAFEPGAAVCGGKGYNLARLVRYGFRVPDGGVLTADAYRRAMGDPAQPCLPADVREAVRDFLTHHGLADAALAVRSSATAEDSATASFAGIHRSVLNVRGFTAVEEAITECYASLWTPQARAYRAKMGLTDEQVQCAVVICRMVRGPVCAGVSFTADPLSGRRDLVVIDAAAGLGENVVSGQVNPQRYVFRRGVMELLAESAPERDGVLTSTQARELAAVSLRIHWALGEGQNPQDIEWAHDGDQLWILQARPVTRLRRAGPEALRRLPRYWSTANITDSLPGVLSEQAWSGLHEVVGTVAFACLTASGYQVPPGLELVRRFEGRGYFDVTLLQWIFLDGYGLPPASTAESLGGTFPLIPLPEGHTGGGGQGWRTLRLLFALRGVKRRNMGWFHRHIATMHAEYRECLEPATPEQLQARLARLVNLQRPNLSRVGVVNSASGGWLQGLRQTLERLFPARAQALLTALCAGSGGVASAEQGYRISELAEVVRQDAAAREWLGSGAPLSALAEDSPFRREAERFLNEFGHRATKEADFAEPRWAQDPTPVFEQVRYILANGACVSREAAERRRRDAEVEIRKAHPLWWPLINWMATGLRRSYAVRELGKSSLVAVGLPMRELFLQVGRHLVEQGHLDAREQVFHLAHTDVVCWMEGYWDGHGAHELAEDNRRRREAWLQATPPPPTIADEGCTIPVSSIEPATHGDTWTGIAVASGRAEGRARIVLEPGAGENLATGDILVAPSTDPGWTPLFLRAAAIVMQTGGFLSHGAIVAREYGLPAVVNIPGILSQIRDGDWLVVDGDNGTVTRCQK